MREPLVLILLAASLVTVALPAQADHASGSVGVADRTLREPIDPLGEPAQLVLDVTIPCHADAPATVWTRASVVDGPDAIGIETAAVTNDTAEACDEGNGTLTVGLPVEVAVTRDAPAFEPVTATLEIRVQENHTDGTTTDLDPVDAEIMATPGYLNLYNVRLERKSAQAEPQTSVTYPIVIENFSNGPTRFEFNIANPDSLPQGFQPIPPSPVILESNATGGSTTSATVRLSVHTPFYNGYVDEEAAIQVRVDSFYAENTTYEGESTHLSTLTQVRGFHVPGPGLLALVALGAAGVIAHRFRR